MATKTETLAAALQAAFGTVPESALTSVTTALGEVTAVVAVGSPSRGDARPP